MVRHKTNCIWIILIAIAIFTSGCDNNKKKNEPTVDLGLTIGDVTEVFSFNEIAVEGYGIVAGLSGTGSPQCPPQLRTYLEKYILRQMPAQKEPGKLIDSKDTAVVLIRGLMPAIGAKNQKFDIAVSVLADDTQTTSLEGGWLYTAEMKSRSSGGFSTETKTLATAQGPVFIDMIDSDNYSKRSGFVLNGGNVLDEYSVNLALRKPDFKMANLIRNKINERFGENTASASSDSQIQLTIPADYNTRKAKFIALVRATYLYGTNEIIKERIAANIKLLASGKDKAKSEIILEAIGVKCIDKLAILLESSNQNVKLSAARCLLNLGDDRGLETLRNIIADKSPDLRKEAFEAIADAAAKDEKASIARRLLRDENVAMRLMAYELLRKINDISVRQTNIADSFIIEEINQSPFKMIFVARSGEPRIALFGAPLYCHDDIFIQSPDKEITINSVAGQKKLVLMRRHPARPGTVLRLESTLELTDIISKLCSDPMAKTKESPLGLGVSYSNMVAILKQMCEKGAVSAEFQAGPISAIAKIVKK